MAKTIYQSRSKLITAILVVLLLFSFSLTAIGASMTTQEDGLEITIDTDKDEYISSDNINATLTVYNTNAYPISNVNMKIMTPDGFRLLDGSAESAIVSELSPDTLQSLDSSFIKLSSSDATSDDDQKPTETPTDTNKEDSTPNSNSNNAQPDNKDTSKDSTNNSEITNDNKTVNSGSTNSNKSTTTRSSSTLTNNRTYTTTGSEKVNKVANTDDNSHLLIWVGIALSSLTMFGLFYHFRKDSKGVGKHILSIGLIVSLMVSSVASFQNVSAEDTNEQKEKTVVTTVKYDGADVSIVGLVSYDDPHENQESDDSIITKYEWIRMLVEHGGYDLASVADTEPFFNDVPKNDPYYPYVQIAYMWNLIEKTDSFDGDNGADEWFVAQSAMRSLGDTRLQSLLNKEINFTEDELFRQATIHNIALERRGKLVSADTCESRLNALTELVFSEEANQEYENIKLNSDVIEFPNPVDVDEVSEDKHVIWSSDNVPVTQGSIVAYQDNEGFYSAGKISEIKQDGLDKTGYVVESTDIDEIFDTYIARETIDVDFDMLTEYFEQYSVEDYDIDESVEPSNTSFKQIDNNETNSLLFSSSSDLEVSDLLKRDESPRLITTGTKSAGYEITVKIDFGKIADKTTITVKDLSSNRKYSYVMDPKKFTLDDSLIETDTNKRKSVTLSITLKDPKVDVAASVKRSGLKLKPYFSVNAASMVSLDAKGSLKGSIEIPLLGKKLKPFDYASFKLGLFLTGSLSGEIESSISVPYRLSLDLSDSGLKTFVDANASSTLKGVLEGEFGLKPELELRLLNDSHGIKLNANQFVGIGGEADYIQRPHTCECIDVSLYAPIAHGSVSADLGIFAKLHAERSLWEVKKSEAPFHPRLHYESNYDGSFEGFVEQCTFEDFGTQSGFIYDASNPYEPVSEAEITVYSGEDIIASTKSDLEGNYSVDLPTGHYKIMITKSGYQEYSEAVDVKKNDNYHVEVPLSKTIIDPADNKQFSEICFDPQNNAPTALSAYYVKSDESADYYLYPEPVPIKDYSVNQNETCLLTVKHNAMEFGGQLPELIHIDGSECSKEEFKGYMSWPDGKYFLSKLYVKNLEPGTRHRLIWSAIPPYYPRTVILDFVTDGDSQTSTH